MMRMSSGGRVGVGGVATGAEMIADMIWDVFLLHESQMYSIERSVNDFTVKWHIVQFAIRTLRIPYTWMGR